MPRLKIVLDTNALIRSVSRHSSYSVILDKLYEDKYDLYITNDILLEYEEKITDIFSPEIAELVLGAFSIIENVVKTDIHFHLELISVDKDDNKFVDCAFSGNVHYLVTDDKHFNKVRSVEFPVINIINLDEFKTILMNN